MKSVNKNQSKQKTKRNENDAITIQKCAVVRQRHSSRCSQPSDSGDVRRGLRTLAPQFRFAIHFGVASSPTAST